MHVEVPVRLDAQLVGAFEQPCDVRMRLREGELAGVQPAELAIDRNEPFRSLAAEDSDFYPIRDEAAFKELVSNGAAGPATG